MCEPTTIAMVTIAVISAATAMYSANQQKHAVEAQARDQQKQIDQQASAQTDDRMKAAREARASARAAAAESGVSGNSSDAALNDLMMQEGRDVSRIERNRENGMAETAQQVRSRTSEINGQLTASLANTAISSYSASRGASAAAPPKTIPGH